MKTDLYTSQVHLKRILAGEATAAFTQPSDEVLAILDPAFFPGMGALNEDEEGRLQCPLRGCGEFARLLGLHLGAIHPSFGGGKALRLLLDLPKKQPLMSARVRAEMRTKLGKGRGSNLRHCSGNRIRAARAAVHKGPRSMMSKNKSDTCPAQLQTQLIALEKKNGRSPSAEDFRAEYGAKGLLAVCAVFGSWNNGKAVAGLSTYERGGQIGMNSARIEDVLLSLRTWVEAHGDLPRTTDCQNPDRAPRIPTHETIEKVFGVTSWLAAMRAALSHLDIESERYGYLKDSRARQVAA